jgi:hypothetical protein
MALVLDTNVVRNIGAGDVDPSGLRDLAREGVTVHLADGTIAELTHQLLSRSLRWDHWVRGRTVLLDTISKDEPVLLGGRLGLHRIGIAGPRPVLQSEIEVELELYDAGWQMLVAANRAEDFAKMSIRLPKQGISVSLPQAHVQATHAEQQDSWPSDFASFHEKMLKVRPDLADFLPAKGDSPEALEGYLNIIREAADANHQPPGPRPSTRLDAFFRVEALLELRHFRKEQPYNPQKNRNDLFDHELLKYLAVPASICTGDSRLIAKVRDSRSWQVDWIVRPEDLARSEVRDRIKKLVWPEDAA